jgi:prefoldin subunit 5
MKDEKKELERIGAKLDYMESTVNMFKHQIMSSIENENMLEELETAVNEAEALDTVLEDRRKSRIRH